jgi:hypothetical protein
MGRGLGLIIIIEINYVKLRVILGIGLAGGMGLVVDGK